MDVSSIALAGLNQAQTQFDKAATRIASYPASADTTNLASDTVDLLQSKNNYSAQISVLKIADEITKSTINLLG